MMEKSWLDKLALSVSPKWGMGRLAHKYKASLLSGTESGYIIPGSRRKSMKGVVARGGSPDKDTIPKLKGSRALSRDLFMNSPVAVATLRRKVINVIGPGLMMQSRVDREFLGLSDEQADKFETSFEREFDMWGESLACDFDGINMFGEMQSLIYLNVLLNGDIFFMLPWRDSPESPYEVSVKLIDSDLVRDPYNKGNRDIQGGVEKNAAGQVVAYHVANFYENEYEKTHTGSIQKSTVFDFVNTMGGSPSINVEGRTYDIKRIPVFDEQGNRQIFHIMNGERVGQRRGMPVFAPVIDALKQMTRLADAELMNALVASYFTVFVKDMSGLGALMQEGFVPSETTTGGGGDGPNQPQVAKSEGDEFDVEMGSGNVVYVDDKKDITLADPRKVDGQFEKFFDVLAMQVCAAANEPAEEALLKFQTSYTAAKAASNQACKAHFVDRWKIDRRFCSICSNEVLREGALKGRIDAPGYFDDMATARAWGRSTWVGTGQGQLNPKDEAQAAVIKVNNKLSTREEEYMADRGGRWDSAMDRYARENKKLDDLGIVDNQNSPELVGADGQINETDE